MLRRLCCLLLCCALSGPAAADTFSVDADYGDAPTAAARAGSLGWAVYQANTTAGADRIEFAVPSDGSPVVIVPVAEYVLTDPGTTIAGFTQPGAQPNSIDAPGGLDAVLMISIDGSQIAGGGRAVFRIETDSVTIEGLNIHSGPLAEVAICLDSTGCAGNAVAGCYLGTDPTGTQARPSGWLPWNPPYAIGVWLANGAMANVIGDGGLGTAPGRRNLIAGERRGDDWLTGHGVLIDGSGTEPVSNSIGCNRIGTDPTGTALANTTGITFLNASSNNDVRYNAVAGNAADGVAMLVVTGDGLNHSNHLTDNQIGLAPDGQAAVPNSGAGILLGPGSQGNRIGQGDLLYGANVISGNTGPGVRIQEDDQQPTRQNELIANLIGLSADGAQALGNGGPGVLIEGAHGEHLSGNVISGNAGHGLQLANGRFESVHDNRIGLAAFDPAPIPNGGDGIRSECGPDDCSYDNTIEDNEISANQGNGYSYLVDPGWDVSESLRDNTIEANQGHGIYIRAAVSNSEVFGNQVLANGQDGVFLDGAGSFDLSSNTIEGNEHYGVRLLPRYGVDASPATAADDVVSNNRLTGNTIQGNGLGGVRAVDTAPANARTLFDDNTIGGNNGLPRVEVLWFAAVELTDEQGQVIDAGAYTISLQGADGSSATLTAPSALPDGSIWGPPGMEADEVRTWALLRDFAVDAQGVFHDANPYTIQVTGPTSGAASWTIDADADDDPGGDVGTPQGIWTGGLYRYQVAQVDTVADSDSDGVDDLDDCAPTDPAYQGAAGTPCDADGDGYCDAAINGNVWQAACPNDCALPICPPGDCDDADPFTHPGADEVACNGEDDDCDPASADDPDATDEDADGYTAGCGQDCDDADPLIFPGANETCGDGVDQDCNGADEACGCADADGDGYTDAACGGNDCDDAAQQIHPNASELCNDADDDCDGRTDEDFGQYTCGTGLCRRTVDVCADGEYQSCVPLDQPEHIEASCADGLDNDCDGYTDEEDLDCAACGDSNADGDADGYEDAACGGADCDDADPAVHPGAGEICNNGIDDDCDGLTDADDDACGKSGGCSCATRSPTPSPALLVLLLLGLAGLRRR